MTHKEVLNLLTRVLVECEMDARVAAAIGEAIEYLRNGFFNKDASREIDRLTAINEQQAEIIELQERRIAKLERTQ